MWDHLKKGQKQRLYGWFQEWADIEAQATVLRWYEPLVAPGLLQTEEYARAILSVRPDGNLDDLDAGSRPSGPPGNFGPNGCAPALVHPRRGRPAPRHRRQQGDAKPALPPSRGSRAPQDHIQVIRSGGTHAGLLGGFIIADLDSKPSVAYLETAAHGQVTDSSSAVGHVALSFDRLRAEAESWAASRDLIRKVAEERWT